MTDATSPQQRQLEDQIHRVMGRQLRVLALFSLLLMVVGFALGHYVAAFQVGYWAESVERQLAELEARIDKQLQESVDHVADSATLQVETLQSEVEQLRGQIADVRSLVESEQTARSERLARLSETVLKQQDQCLEELDAYRQHRRPVPVDMVVQCVQRLSTARLEDLSALAGGSPSASGVVNLSGVAAPASDTLPESAAGEGEAAATAVYFAPPPVSRATFISKSRGVEASTAGPLLTPPLH